MNWDWVLFYLTELIQYSIFITKETVSCKLMLYFLDFKINNMSAII